MKHSIDVGINSGYKPRIRFSEKELPEIKEWDINKKYKLQIEVVLKNKGEDYFEDGGIGGTFMVENVKAIEEDKIKKLKEKYEHA